MRLVWSPVGRAIRGCLDRCFGSDLARRAAHFVPGTLQRRSCNRLQSFFGPLTFTSEVWYHSTRRDSNLVEVGCQPFPSNRVLAVHLLGGGYFRFIELITPKTTTAIRLSNISISSVVILSPPFFGEGKSAVLSRPVLSVSLEHVNIMTWVSSIVNYRGCSHPSEKGFERLFC